MSVRMQGRVAGLIYLGVVVFGTFALLYVPSKLIVDGDAAATNAAISANPMLFSAGNVAAIIMYGCFLALPFALAKFLSRYGSLASRLMILCVVASMPTSILTVGQYLAIDGLLGQGAADIGEVAARLADHVRWLDITQIFWGAWLAPLAWLILKSGAVPRVLGGLLLAGFAGYVGAFLAPRFFPGLTQAPYLDWASSLGSVGEIGTCLWLLVMGARRPNIERGGQRRSA